VVFNGVSINVPANKPVVGNTLGWFEGRIYSPSFTLSGEHDGVLNFAGYHTPKPNDNRGDYRSIGSVRLHFSRHIVAISNGADHEDNDDKDEHR
jgi:hypothetical protein